MKTGFQITATVVVEDMTVKQFMSNHGKSNYEFRVRQAAEAQINEQCRIENAELYADRKTLWDAFTELRAMFRYESPHYIMTETFDARRYDQLKAVIAEVVVKHDIWHGDVWQSIEITERAAKPSDNPPDP